MIAIHNLVKQYGKFTAVDGITLDVQPGEIHGFLGPNGAGKTTTLRMIAGLYGLDGDGVIDRVHEMLDLFELRRWENELVESFSHGMKQRLVMCAAFLHRPQAVVVDEPMVGLDPRGARLIKDVFRRMAGHGVAVLMSTHTLEVAQEMCDRISIILKGRIIASGTVKHLLA